MDNGDGLISDQSAEGVKWDVSGLPLGPSSVALYVQPNGKTE